jgi:transposase
MVAELRATVDDLKRQLGQNSSNSNKPPSSDAPADRGARGGKEPSGKPRGGQPGHKGWKRTLVPPDKVNRTRDIYPERCRRRGCGKQLSRQPDANPICHQVVEVPPITPDVTEYRLHRVACDCGKITCGSLPTGVPRMCGPRLMALIGLLSGRYKMSRRDGASFLSDVLGVKISLGALSESEDDVSEAIAVPVEEARVHVSEQGVRGHRRIRYTFPRGPSTARLLEVDTLFCDDPLGGCSQRARRRLWVLSLMPPSAFADGGLLAAGDGTVDGRLGVAVQWGGFS